MTRTIELREGRTYRLKNGVVLEPLSRAWPPEPAWCGWFTDPPNSDRHSMYWWHTDGRRFVGFNPAESREWDVAAEVKPYRLDLFSSEPPSRSALSAVAIFAALMALAVVLGG